MLSVAGGDITTAVVALVRATGTFLPLTSHEKRARAPAESPSARKVVAVSAATVGQELLSVVEHTVVSACDAVNVAPPPPALTTNRNKSDVAAVTEAVQVVTVGASGGTSDATNELTP